MNRNVSAILVFALLAQCIVHPVPSFGADANAQRHYGRWGFDLEGQDHNQRPGDDFYRFANGSFVENLVIPAERMSESYGDQLFEQSDTRIAAIVENASESEATPPQTLQGKIGAFYASFMDEKHIENLGAAPLAPELENLANINTKADLAFFMGKSAGGLQQSLFSIDVRPDEKDSKIYSVYLMQGGLGLPDREFYLDAQFAQQTLFYQEYIQKVLTFVNWPDAATIAPAILNLERDIAKTQLALADLRNPEITYNKLSIFDLQELAPGFPWRSMMSGASLPDETQVVIDGKSTFAKMASIYNNTSLTVLKAWEAFHLIDNSSIYLSSTFADAHFDYHERKLAGTQAFVSRKIRAAQIIDANLGDAVGQLYAQNFFPQESKAMVISMALQIKEAFAKRIHKLDWMSQNTKDAALKKLKYLRVKVGYPDKWRDYSGLTLDRQDLFGNVIKIIRYNWDFRRSHLRHSVDHDEWITTPQTVNAYYHPAFNEIVFPAAILQPPFFDPWADPAVNYGAIGSLIGHEITHGFDDQGRQYDFDGSLHNWWNKNDLNEFHRRSEELVAAFQKIAVMPGANIDGKLTLDENMADLGGALVALDAYHASRMTTKSTTLDGFSDDARFFLGYSQIWRGKVRTEALRQNLVADPHSPFFARVNGILPNIDDWYTAFGILPSDKLYRKPSNRIRIW